MFMKTMVQALWGFVRDGLATPAREEAEQQLDSEFVYGGSVLSPLATSLNTETNQLINTLAETIAVSLETMMSHPLHEEEPRMLGTWMRMDNLLHWYSNENITVPNGWLGTASELASHIHQNLEQSSKHV